MGLIAMIFFLTIAFVAVRALASLQVSYAAFDKENGPAAHKKAQWFAIIRSKLDIRDDYIMIISGRAMKEFLYRTSWWGLRKYIMADIHQYLGFAICSIYLQLNNHHESDSRFWWEYGATNLFHPWNQVVEKAIEIDRKTLTYI